MLMAGALQSGSLLAVPVAIDRDPEPRFVAFERIKVEVGDRPGLCQ